MGSRGPKPGSPKPAGSGRKRGTPNKISRPFRELAQLEAVPTIKRLVELRDQNDHPVIALQACRELLDRAFGKPEQPLKAEIETTDKTEVIWNWTPELLAEVRRLGLVYTPLGPYSAKPAYDEPPPLQYRGA